MNINYVGENLFAGEFGHLSIIFAFITALIAFVGFYKTSTSSPLERESWSRFSKTFYLLHAFGIFAAIGTIFYLIGTHSFEYMYVWQHSDSKLPWYYIVSSFWEGQEGSYLLWMFWNLVLGFVVLFRSDLLKHEVLCLLMLLQAVMVSMVLGIHVFYYKIGSSPFMLLRDVNYQAPIFNRANYLEFIDGNGLNPLLQNYWMVIHPVIMFLGFASSFFPFAFGFSALWKQEYESWSLPALKWSLFNVIALGTGLVMGMAWAYEALSFGGYWAWDPVENSSLVPWLTMVAGVHTLMAYRATKHALRASFIFLIISFLLVLYSSFLTKSGILGDTSVHSFTDLGMSGQLVFSILLFLIPAVGLLLYRWKSIPEPEKEESAYSREFWLFIGAMVLTFSAALISFTTSIPVWNYFLEWFNIDPLAPPIDPEEHYNKYQIIVGIFIGLMAALVQFLRYKEMKPGAAIKRAAIPFGLAILTTVFIAYISNIYAVQYLLLLFAGWFTIFANLTYIIAVLRGKIKVAGGSIAHIGFGLMLIGVLISSGKKEVVSINEMGIEYGESFSEDENEENILLYKDRPLIMNGYNVTYVGDTMIYPNTYYKVNYEELDEQGNPTGSEFQLEPNIQINPKMGLVSNPSTKHYFTRDIFTQITSVPDKSAQDEYADSLREYSLSKGDTIFNSSNFIVFRGVNTEINNADYEAAEGDIAVTAIFKVFTMDSTYFVEPVYYIRDNYEFNIPAEVEELGLKIVFKKIVPDQEKILIGVKDDAPLRDYIIMKATIFPYINVLWLGLILMIIGSMMSWRQRLKQRNGKQT